MKKILADSKLREDRMSECNSCEHYKKLFRKCGKCGCIMPAKVSLLAARCPIDKW